MMPCDVCGFIFLGVRFKSKNLRENKKKHSFWKNFDIRFLFREFFGLKHAIVTFYLPYIFQYIPLENVVNYFCFKEKQVSAFC